MPLVALAERPFAAMLVRPSRPADFAGGGTGCCGASRTKGRPRSNLRHAPKTSHVLLLFGFDRRRALGQRPVDGIRGALLESGEVAMRSVGKATNFPGTKDSNSAERRNTRVRVPLRRRRFGLSAGGRRGDRPGVPLGRWRVLALTENAERDSRGPPRAKAIASASGHAQVMGFRGIWDPTLGSRLGGSIADARVRGKKSCRRSDADLAGTT